MILERRKQGLERRNKNSNAVKKNSNTEPGGLEHFHAVLSFASQKGAEGAAIGGAVGLLFGQMLDNKAAKKAQQRTQTANPQQTLPQGPVTTGAPQIDPVTGLPIDPNAAALATPPAIDPATGLPVGVGAPSPTAVPIPAVRQALTPRQRVNKLFGR